MFEPVRMIVTGRPAPQGSKVPIIVKTRTGLRPGLKEDTTGNWHKWRPRIHDEAIRIAACGPGCGDPDCNKLRPGFPIADPIEASMVFYFDRPADHFKAPTRTRAAFTELKPDAPLVPAKSPIIGDCEKLARAVCDGMQSGQLIANDGLIARYVKLERRYTGPAELLQAAGVIVWLWPYRADIIDPRYPDQLAAAPPGGGLLDLLGPDELAARTDAPPPRRTLLGELGDRQARAGASDPATRAPRGAVAPCRHCGVSVRHADDGQWEDADGWGMCRGLGEQFHAPRRDVVAGEFVADWRTCQHCTKAIYLHHTDAWDAWLDADGLFNCQKDLHHQPMPAVK